MNDIAARIARVRDTIDATARLCGRRTADIKLVAVTKGHSLAALRAAADAGQHAFGENTVQEALKKIPHFTDRSVEWHYIGHLQSNKAKSIPGNFSWIHSLDDAHLAQRLARTVLEKNTTIEALIEVNITGDTRKHGVAPAAVFPMLDRLLEDGCDGLRLRGLMTIGPHRATESELRTVFARLRALRDDCAQRLALPGFAELSMGMSGDYVEAIKEGATMLRIGTAIFGTREIAE